MGWLSSFIDRVKRAWTIRWFKRHPGVIVPPHREVMTLRYRFGRHAIVETYEGPFPIYWIVRLPEKDSLTPTEAELVEGHSGAVTMGRKRIFAAAVAACQRLERESNGGTN